MFSFLLVSPGRVRGDISLSDSHMVSQCILSGEKALYEHRYFLSQFVSMYPKSPLPGRYSPVPSELLSEFAIGRVFYDPGSEGCGRIFHLRTFTEYSAGLSKLSQPLHHLGREKLFYLPGLC